ncbi:Na/Pi cotransporter family protein [Candidatus Gracilibacteria bacterium]|nr:Na/Pi cotransporter family protein [Candidatus Gracilibacteria bacterium]
MNYGDLLGGLGIFLFGMILFEETIKSLGKNTLKRFMERHTNTRLKSILIGMVETAILQSSTIVTMMTLGFVGAGIMGVANALGVVLGANLGSTLTPWIISFLGFKLDIAAFALPIIGIGALSMLTNGDTKFGQIGRFLVGFGFLFLGLDYMKESVEILTNTVSLDQYAHLSIWGFVLVGMVLTTLIQTSTGATVITLTALNAGLITLDMALGIVIGANMGSALSTTIIGFLASTRAQNNKRQVAFGHFIFNIVMMVLVTCAYQPIKSFIFLILDSDTDPTIVLAFFHTLYNLILVAIWTPLLSPLIRFLRYLFPRREHLIGLTLENINSTVPEEIITAITKDVYTFLGKTIHYNRALLLLGEGEYSPARSLERYVEIKQMEEKILTCITRYATNEYTHTQTKILQTLNTAMVHILTSSKHLKDVAHHIDNIHEQESEAIMRESYGFFQQIVGKTTNTVYEWMKATHLSKKTLYEHIADCIGDIRHDSDAFMAALSVKVSQTAQEINIAEVVKVNYYILLSSESLLRGYEGLADIQKKVL